MRLFRSEEHVTRWSEKSGIPVVNVFPLDWLWRMAQMWFRDRLSPSWRRATIDEAHAVFEQAGLTGPFWRLDG
jgi:hypothetical protein